MALLKPVQSLALLGGSCVRHGNASTRYSTQEARLAVRRCIGYSVSGFCRPWRAPGWLDDGDRLGPAGSRLDWSVAWQQLIPPVPAPPPSRLLPVSALRSRPYSLVSHYSSQSSMPSSGTLALLCTLSDTSRPTLVLPMQPDPATSTGQECRTEWFMLSLIKLAPIGHQSADFLI